MLQVPATETRFRASQKGFGYLLVATVCLLLSQGAALRASEPLSVTLGQAPPIDSPDLVLDLGSILLPFETSVDLDVHNETTSDLPLAAFSDGAADSLSWTGVTQDPELPASLAIIPAGGVAKLELKLKWPKGSPDIDVPVIWLAYLGVPVSTIRVRARIFETETVSLEIVTPNLTSGKGKAYSAPYRVCSGPNPPGYAISTSKFILDKDNQDSMERRCGMWAYCDPLPVAADGNLCWEFRIQGHEENVLGNHEDHLTYAHGILSVTYHLIKSDPVLIAE